MKRILAGLTVLVMMNVIIGCDRKSPSKQDASDTIMSRADAIEVEVTVKPTEVKVTGKPIKAETLSQTVIGTSVRIKPPAGFVKADRFPGFMNESTKSSIMVTELPAPYSEVTRGFTDAKLMKAQNMTLLEKSTIVVDGYSAMLLHLEQPAYGILFNKWVLVVDYPKLTTMITASFPKAESAGQGELLKSALLSLTFGKKIDPMDALIFTITPEPPFEVATVMGQNLVLTPNGQFPIKDKNAPYIMASLSFSKGLVVANTRTFAVKRILDIAKTAKLKDFSIESNEPVTIGPLSGHTIIANGVDIETDVPMTIYQVLLTGSSEYTVIVGLTPTDQKDKYLPIFKNISRTFSMK